MKELDLKLRTKRFALDVIKFVEGLPKEVAITVASINTARKSENRTRVNR